MLLLSLLLVPGLLFAGTTGKIKGKVVDKESKEALVGANVGVEGTTFGAATDVNGEYTILNVSAGFYTIKASFVGYTAVNISNVRVNSDLTTSLDFALSSEAVALAQVEIIAERPLINKNATNAVRIATGEDIAALPVRGINNVYALSPGVVIQDNAVFVRGGRQDEVGFYLEGISITNPMLGGRAVNLVTEAIEEIQIQAGGYNAEFGGANSGIIQQQLKSGTSNWKASLFTQTDNVGFRGKSKIFDSKKTLGAYYFGYNEMTGTLSGPLGTDAVKFFGLFAYNFQRDKDPQPYPGINLRGLFTPNTTNADTIDLVYPAGPTLKNSQEQITGTGTFTLDFKPLTIRLAGTYTHQKTFNPFNGTRNPGQIANIFNTDRIENVLQENGAGSAKFTYLINPTTLVELTGGYFQQSQKNYDPFLEDNFTRYGDSAANAAVGYTWPSKYVRPDRYLLYNFAFNRRGDVVSSYQKFKRVSINLSGSFFTQVDEHALKIGGEFQRYSIRNFSLGNERILTLAKVLDQNAALPTGDPNKLTPEQILIRGGVNNFGYDVLGNETDDTGSDLTDVKHPVFAAAYVQDKVEYNDLTINFGLRFDYINSDSKAFIDPYHPELSINKNTNELYPAGFVDVAKFQSVSPRLGLSFPVSDRTVFHTQFGKFVQQSRLRDIYNGLYATGSNIAGGFFIGNPVGFDVRPTRTTQYEIGFTQQLGDFTSFDITGYYKDVKDQIVYDQIYPGTGSPYGAYQILKNGDFATTKGIEVSINMRRQKRLQMSANLSFNDARGTGSFPNSNRGIINAPLDGVTVFRPQYVTPLEFNNAVRGSVNLDYRFAKDDAGPILQQLGASVLVTFNSGHPFTLGRGGADLEGDARDRQPLESLNSSNTPWNFQVDLRVDKTFNIFDRLNANVYIFVINVFDTKNVQNVFLRTGSTDDDGYLSDPQLGGTLIATYGPRYAETYKAINLDYYEQWQNAPFLGTVPFFFGPPRQVRFGVRLDY
jgi:outer membrane receptor for ferrienterochelin and colicin